MDNLFVPVSSISFMLCLCHFIKFIVCSDHPAYLPGDVSINCGSVGTFAAQHGREWLGDKHPIFASSLQIKGKSTISRAVGNSVPVDPIPYKTARISSSGFSYVFLVNPGEKFIRLHFNPTPYKGFQKYKDLFTVEAGPFTLLGNFSASLTADALGLSSIIKEFCISVEENQPLHIVFTPTVSHSGDTFAFLNGIEIITVPPGHSYFRDDGNINAQVVGGKSQQIYVDNSTTLEMVRRVNIKPYGDEIRDKFGMWGTVLREKANQSNNIEWNIPVDVGFRYLIRLHLSYLGLKLVQETGSAKFEVLINGVFAYNNIDLARERDIYNIIANKDYIVMLKGHKNGFKHDIVVSLRSYHEFFDGYGPFMGFEILKLSNLENSLACPNPLPPAHDSSSSIVHTLLSVCGNRNVIVTISITIIALTNIIIHKLREIWEASFTEEEIKPSARAERFCRRFSLSEMKLATKNFSYHLIIGKGGFGKVYKGLIDHGKETVAIKRLKAHSSQGAHEFLTEIETLSELRHINLVQLIGYCSEQTEMILVYEYMACGTLGDHLYKLSREGSSCASLAWKQRLNICIGAGRGLEYLHTGHGDGVIHRDVKASNILLDENFTPKVSDFGLVKRENLSKLQTHVSTKVKGTFGYLDPTYYDTGKLTRKSDTYAFGVVLLEVLCGRPAIDQRVSETEQILTKWAQNKIREGEVELIVDSNLKQEILPNSLKAFVEIVERCLDDEPKKRPTMAQVVSQLVFSLDQQDIVESSVPKEITINASCSDETKVSVGEQATCVDERIPTLPQKEQTNNQIGSDDLLYRRKKGRKVSSYKPSRIWPWDAIWKRVEPSRKNENSISEICEEDIKLPKYDWSMIKSGTNRFSSSNWVGGSLYGPSYYKAVFRSGQIVVVKILSGRQRHARAFMKEILMVQNLQHPNILKPLGYCIHEEEMMLVHKFMENESLDKFIFGKFQHLGWRQRFKIIMGIARGFVYLHEDSGTRTIHTGLKTNRILLDIHMNPRISGFCSVQTVEEDAFESITRKVWGRGYMCPEYMEYHKVSEMTDVYSYGVVVLEIVSGRKCVSTNGQHIIRVALELWKECKALQLVDESILGSLLFPVEEEEVLRCIKVGLLCTQISPGFRPTMPSVIKLLEGELSMELQDQ